MKDRFNLSPTAQRRIYAVLALGFFLMAVASYVFGFQSNVAYVSKLSELALIGAALACYQSTRGEIKQDVLIDAVPGAEQPA